MPANVGQPLLQWAFLMALFFTLTFGWLGRILVRKSHGQLEQPSCPYRIGPARNAHFPHLQVRDAICVPGWLCVESERVVLAPLLALLLEPVDAERHDPGEGLLAHGSPKTLNQSGRDVYEQATKASKTCLAICGCHSVADAAWNFHRTRQKSKKRKALGDLWLGGLSITPSSAFRLTFLCKWALIPSRISTLRLTARHRP